jgi:acetylglutamate kinase
MRIVVKIAGALLENDAAVASLAAQLAALVAEGHEILVVHGGGRIFTSTLERMGISSRFVSGLRVTDAPTRDVAVMVFAGLLGKRLAAAISSAGRPAVGICAADAGCFSAEPMTQGDETGGLGYVGYLTGVNVPFLEALWGAGIVPVAACLGQGPDGELYNINADHMAAACADYIRAARLIYLTDVEGVLDSGSVVPELACDDIEPLIRTGKVNGGMVLKLEACQRAIDSGVEHVRIVGGTLPNVLHIALGDAPDGGAGLGTRVIAAAPVERALAARFQL